MRRLLAFVLAGLLASAASAQDREARIQALMEAQGLLTTVQEQLAAGRARSRAMADQVMASVLKDLVADAATQEKIGKAAAQFLDEAQNPVTASDIVAIWSDAYGSKFSDAELDGLLAYYRTPLAQKEVQASRQAMAVMGERLQAGYKPVIDAALAHYVQHLKAIVAECHCAKPASAP